MIGYNQSTGIDLSVGLRDFYSDPRAPRGNPRASVLSNTIVGNPGAGVFVHGENNLSGLGVILSNSITDNGHLGIDLNPPGVNPIGMPGAVTINAPQLDSASTSGGATTVVGGIVDYPSSPFVVQFFASPEADPSGSRPGPGLPGPADGDHQLRRPRPVRVLAAPNDHAGLGADRHGDGAVIIVGADPHVRVLQRRPDRRAAGDTAASDAAGDAARHTAGDDARAPSTEPTVASVRPVVLGPLSRALLVTLSQPTDPLAAGNPLAYRVEALGRRGWRPVAVLGARYSPASRSATVLPESRSTARGLPGDVQQPDPARGPGQRGPSPRRDRRALRRATVARVANQTICSLLFPDRGFIQTPLFLNWASSWSRASTNHLKQPCSRAVQIPRHGCLILNLRCRSKSSR